MLSGPGYLFSFPVVQADGGEKESRECTNLSSLK